jgi:glycosyltransferase involved in cell wall biosynthesis
LQDCLESVINQTYRPFEVLVTDDASTDNSIDIIKKYEKKYKFIKGIYNKVNRGVALNRHNAILEAKGNYITMLDSDDYLFSPYKFEKEMNLIRKYKLEYNKDIISYSNIVRVDEDRNIYNETNIIEGNILASVITRSNPVPRDFIMLKKQYIEAGGYDQDIKLYEDWDLVIRLARKNEFYYTNTEGTGYRVHGQGLSSVNYRKHIKWLDIVFSKNIDFINDQSIDIFKKNYNLFLLRFLINNLNIDNVDKDILSKILERFTIIDNKKEEKVKSILEKINTKDRVVVFGGGKHTERLLNLPVCQNMNIIKVLDKNQNLKGKKIQGIEITVPDEIEEIDPDIVIISSFDYQGQIENELINNLNFKKEIVKFYDENDNRPFYQL